MLLMSFAVIKVIQRLRRNKEKTRIIEKGLGFANVLMGYNSSLISRLAIKKKLLEF